MGSFTEAQQAKFKALDPLFRGRTPERLYRGFQQALTEFLERGRAQA